MADDGADVGGGYWLASSSGGGAGNGGEAREEAGNDLAPPRARRRAGTGPGLSSPGAAGKLRWVRRPTTRALVPGVIFSVTVVQVLRGAQFRCTPCFGGAAELRRKTWWQDRPTRPDYYLQCPDCGRSEALSAPAVEQLVSNQRPQALGLLWSFR
jgi:hypothetical protein